MPSTVVNSDRPSSVNFVANRTRRRPTATNTDTITPRITTRRAQRTLIGKNDANGCSTTPDDDQRQDNNVNKIQSIPEKDTTEYSTISPVENNLTALQRHSNVTTRTRSRQTKSVGQTSNERLAERDRHTITSASGDHPSIIHLDESSNIGTKSITEAVDSSRKQATFSGNDVSVQSSSKEAAISEPRRTTRRISTKPTDCNQNTISSRTVTKRKTNDELPPHETGVSPPKQALGATQHSALEHSVKATGEKGIMPVTVEKSTENSLAGKLNSDAFKILIVSIKRLAPALTANELKRLKYEDSTHDSRLSLRPSSSRANWRQKSSIKVERPTLVGSMSNMAKPKLVITSPIVEVPETPPPVLERNTLVNNSFLTVPPNTSNTKLDMFKKPFPSKHPPLPLLIEEEDEENDDVYAFLSSSQNSDISSTNKTKQQLKPRQKKGPTASAAKSTNKKNMRNVSTAKPKGKSQKQAKLFGCNKYELRKVIKKLGGGPVKQPKTVDYKINLEIPKTPPVASSPVNVPQQMDNFELPNDDHLSLVEASRITNPTVNRLKTGSLTYPTTSTLGDRVSTANKLSIPSVEKPASPWRLQDDLIVPRTSYAHRSKEMLPSYESFATANNNTEHHPVGAFDFVTERRKSPSDGMPADPLPLLTAEPCDGTITDKELREIEQMYVELKATSEMSEKLIRAMRLSKQKATTPQQEQTMRQASLKLRKWYDRSMNAFSRSMRILGNLQQHRPTASDDRSTTACPSPLSQEQQRTLNEFNSSTDRFRSMLAQLHSTINDSDIENRPPPQTTAVTKAAATPGKGTPANKKIDILQDIIILPARSDAAKRNPLMPLKVVPLPQRDSPVMSPLAITSTNPGPRAATGPNNTRRELEYDKENELSIQIIDNENQPKDADDVPPIITTIHSPDDSVVELNDNTMREGNAQSDQHVPATQRSQNSRNYFGFDDDDNSSSVVESSIAQVTLPMPLNISHETLERRLKNVKELLPKRPFFRAQAKQQSARSSGPTRFPLAPKLRVISSPTKRLQTLRDFVASTPRAGSSKKLVPLNEAPDVSAIEPIASDLQQVEERAERNNESEVVALFDTPDRPAWLNNTAHQRTYSRIPKRRQKKKNIYLANLGLDDDSEDDEDGEPQELSSDSETDRKKKASKQKRKAQRKKPIPVEKTKDFKEFVDSFNSMCEQVERYEMIVE